MNPVDLPLGDQIDLLLEITFRNPVVKEILNTSFFPKNINWYLGAGGICQSVWNFLSGNEITHGIKDYDLIYYDRSDLSFGAEDVFIQKGKEYWKKYSNLIEIRNQARVHLWFEKHFGYKIKPLKSCEESINGWPTTARAIGINKIDQKINVYAPYGLNDLFGLVVRPNKLSITKQVYEKKVQKWTSIWPNLKIIKWGKI